jgi:ankyrin repeat protein
VSLLNDCCGVTLQKDTELETEKVDYSPAGLFRAIETRNVIAVRLLLSTGMKVAIKNGSGWTPLIASAVVGSLQVTEALVGAGADVKARDPQGYTSLHWAAFKGYSRVAELLLAKGADVNA